MIRLKITLAKNGMSFLSPFVYTEAQAQRRLSKFKWMLKKGDVLELVDVGNNYPRNAEYNLDKMDLGFISDLITRWEYYERKQEDDNREDIEEMEEGSTRRR